MALPQSTNSNNQNTFSPNYRLPYRLKQVLRYGLGFPYYALQAFTNKAGLSALGNIVLVAQSLDSKQELVSELVSDKDTLTQFIIQIEDIVNYLSENHANIDNLQKANDWIKHKDYSNLYNWWMNNYRAIHDFVPNKNKVDQITNDAKIQYATLAPQNSQNAVNDVERTQRIFVNKISTIKKKLYSKERITNENAAECENLIKSYESNNNEIDTLMKLHTWLQQHKSLEYKSKVEAEEKENFDFTKKVILDAEILYKIWCLKKYRYETEDTYNNHFISIIKFLADKLQEHGYITNQDKSNVDNYVNQNDSGQLWQWYLNHQNNLGIHAHIKEYIDDLNSTIIYQNQNQNQLDRDPKSRFIRLVYNAMEQIEANATHNSGQNRDKEYTNEKTTEYNDNNNAQKQQFEKLRNWIGNKIANKEYARLNQWIKGQHLANDDIQAVDTAYQQITDATTINNHFASAYKQELKQPALDRFRNEQHINQVEEPEVVTGDGVKLETVELAPQPHNGEEKYIIKFIGNGEMWPMKVEEISRHVQDGYHVIAFNPRGVGISEGHARSIDDLVRDGIAQVERVLQKKNIKEQNVIIDGHSLGAGYGTLVADYCHNQRKDPARVKINNGRSFSTLTNYVMGQALVNLGEKPGHALRRGCLHAANYFNRRYKNSTNNRWYHYANPLRASCKALQEGFKVVGYGLNLTWQLPTKALIMSFKPLVKSVLLLANWEINAGDAFKRIPNEYKACYRVATPESYKPAYHNKYDEEGNFDIIPHHYDVEDGIITDYASICHSVSLWEHVQRFMHRNAPQMIAKKFQPHANVPMFKTEGKNPDNGQGIDKDTYHNKEVYKKAGHNLERAMLITQHSPFISTQYSDDKTPQNANEFSNNFFEKDPHSSRTNNNS